MITIGIVTFYTGNYGAFLQAYSLQRTLCSLGYKAEIINYDGKSDKKLLGVPLYHIKNPLVFSKQLAVEIIKYNDHKKKRIIFEKSVKKHLLLSRKRFKHVSDLFFDPPKYDIYLTGSDQVFNPLIESQSFTYRLLDFTTGKKVSYSASSGSVENYKKFKSQIINSLSTFSILSVREESLKEELSSQLNKNVYCHIDPVFLLSDKEWKHFGERPTFLPKKYILYYTVLDDKKMHDTAEKLSSALRIPIFSANGRKKFTNQIDSKICLSPEQWIGALADAEYVVTNSFHGTAFSIIFKKKAIVLLPSLNHNRITDLISRTALSRLLDDNILLPKNLDSLFDNSIMFIENEKEKSLSFLKSLKDIF